MRRDKDERVERKEIERQKREREEEGEKKRKFREEEDRKLKERIRGPPLQPTTGGKKDKDKTTTRKWKERREGRTRTASKKKLMNYRRAHRKRRHDKSRMGNFHGKRNKNPKRNVKSRGPPSTQKMTGQCRKDKRKTKQEQ